MDRDIKYSVKTQNYNLLDGDLSNINDEKEHYDNTIQGMNVSEIKYYQREVKKWKYSTVLLAVVLVLTAIVFIIVLTFLVHECNDKDTTGQLSSSLKDWTIKPTIQTSTKRPECTNMEYWTGFNCAKKKAFKSCCTSSNECKESLGCIDQKCVCNDTEIWSGVICLQQMDINETCTLSMQCKGNMECINYICNCKEKQAWMENQCLADARECSEIATNQDGVYTIFPVSYNIPVQAYCIMGARKKWTVIHRRLNATVDFDRTWLEYKDGFGSAYGEYWLGNENIHAITSNGQHEISFFLISTDGKEGHANYSSFTVDDESSGYMLHVSGYSGDIDDAINYKDSKFSINGHKFSTKDKDNDKSFSTHCGQKYEGGWWYNKCHAAHLNGNVKNHGRKWYPWAKNIKYSVMMITKHG